MTVPDGAEAPADHPSTDSVGGAAAPTPRGSAAAPTPRVGAVDPAGPSAGSADPAGAAAGKANRDASGASAAKANRDVSGVATPGGASGGAAKPELDGAGAATADPVGAGAATADPVGAGAATAGPVGAGAVASDPAGEDELPPGYRRSGLRNPAGAVRGMGAAALGLQGVVLLLAIQPIRVLGEGVGAGAVWASVGLAVICFVLCGMMRRPWVWTAGSVVQGLLVVSGLLHWTLFALGVIFTMVWLYVLYVRRSILR